MTPIVATLCLAALFPLQARCEREKAPAPCLPVPSEQQIRLQDMEMYAFIHYSLNTYTDQEWGYGDEPPSLFNPSDLDCRQWARVCKSAGMRGIILTAKHHCGFCLWPSAYTDYSVRNSPWKDGQGDVVRELADACRREGLKFAVYLSPWDRHHAQYGRPEYVTYFRRQLQELLTRYGPIFEIWFDGANGGDGWYGGACETRSIDRRSYYRWEETFPLVRQWQPDIVIWSDAGGPRGDLRWVGTEAGFVGTENWSLLPSEGNLSRPLLQHGSPEGNLWVPGEVDVSIRPGWFYHVREDAQVKSVGQLMDIYYKSVGRNSTLLLNFPVMPSGRIHPTDSLRAAAFGKAVREAFRHDLARGAHATASNVRAGSRQYQAGNVLGPPRPNRYWATDDSVRRATLVLRFARPTEFNRILLEEPIALGQRIRSFSLEALVGGRWVALRDQLSSEPDALTTVGRRRILCFPTVTATHVRLTVREARACPLLSRFSVYCVR
ncbi:MAG: alpha-L-fucosidase [Bacteroidaceae bacterium]|nr:alpha-L-fucosidase [Bacteroidaceae bacterium]